MSEPADRPTRAAWLDTEARAEALTDAFRGDFRLRRFEHRQSTALQPGVPRRLRRDYGVPVAYTDWGPPDAPVLVCLGGVVNTAMRFCCLAQSLCTEFRVVCMDWLGRGQSGWLADGSEYGLASYVAQLGQLVDHLGAARVSVLGSSLGGSVAMAYAARRPQRVERLVLNDVGPAIPRARRVRRAETLARFYVFRDPEDLLRRIGAAQKHDGPLSDEVRLFLAYHQTRWSEDNDGRIYRHDPRALLAYQRDAAVPFDQWQAWSRLRCPVLALHGLLSDALVPATLARMRRTRPDLAIAHVPQAGHTPALWSRSQVQVVRDWLRGAVPPGAEWTLAD